MNYFIYVLIQRRRLFSIKLIALAAVNKDFLVKICMNINLSDKDLLQFQGYFQYQLQTGVVLAYDKTGQSVWSSAINAPIAAVWELKDGQLMEKSLFETTTNYVPSDDLSKKTIILIYSILL